jgi:hypothetical protein
MANSKSKAGTALPGAERERLLLGLVSAAVHHQETRVVVSKASCLPYTRAPPISHRAAARTTPTAVLEKGRAVSHKSPDGLAVDRIGRRVQMRGVIIHHDLPPALVPRPDDDLLGEPRGHVRVSLVLDDLPAPLHLVPQLVAQLDGVGEDSTAAAEPKRVFRVGSSAEAVCLKLSS